MFYNQLMKLCEENNEKPTPLLRSLGLSATNLKRWQNGSTVNSEILAKLADHFNVPVDYFFQEDDTENETAITNDANAFQKVYNIFRAHPDNIASFLSGDKIPVYNYEQIVKYLACSDDYLFNKNNSSVIDKSIKPCNNLSAKEYILNIMNKLPANSDYQVMQVKLSYIVINNLKKVGKGKAELIELKLAQKKIDRLYDDTIEDSKKRGLNLSDLNRIVEAFDLSYDYLFTGENKG